MPGTIMAMGRLNRPSIMVYGGTIKVWDFTFHKFFYFANTGVQFFFFFFGEQMTILTSLYRLITRKNCLGVAPICWLGILKARPHRCHEALETIRPTPWVHFWLLNNQVEVSIIFEHKWEFY